MALAKLCCFCSKEEQVNRLTYIKVVATKRLAAEERGCAFKAQITISARLLHFKKVYKKIRLKEYYLVEQGLYKLEADKKKGFQLIREGNSSLYPSGGVLRRSFIAFN